MLPSHRYIYAGSLCVRPGVTPRSTATIILLNPVRINSCCLGQATVPSTGCLSYLPSPSTGSRLFKTMVYQSMSAGSLTYPPSMYTQAKPREARLCENRKKPFFFCSLRREREIEKAFGNRKANGCLHIVSEKVKRKSSNCAMILGRVYVCMLVSANQPASQPAKNLLEKTALCFFLATTRRRSYLLES